MPSAVVLDTCCRMSSSLDDEDSTLAVLQRGLLEYFKALEGVNPEEQVALISYEKNGTVVVPCTNAVKLLRAGCYQVQEGKADGSAAAGVKCALDHLMAQESKSEGLQLLLLACSYCLKNSEDIYKLGSPVARIHVVLCDMSASPAASEVSRLADFAAEYGGRFDHVRVPQDHRALKRTLSECCLYMHTRPVTEVHFGNLSAKVMLRPHGNASPKLPVCMPDYLSVHSFLQADRVYAAIPATDHYITPLDEKDREFLFVLHNALIRTRTVACAPMGGSWYAFLYAAVTWQRGIRLMTVNAIESAPWLLET